MNAPPAVAVGSKRLRPPGHGNADGNGGDDSGRRLRAAPAGSFSSAQAAYTKWCEDRTILFGDVLPGEMFQQLAALHHCVNREMVSYWLPIDPARRALLARPSCFIEEVIEYLYHHIMTEHILSSGANADNAADASDSAATACSSSLWNPPIVPPILGAEWWVHMRNVQESMDLHFDKDEGKILKHSALHNPTSASSILVSTTATAPVSTVAHPVWSSVFYLTSYGGPTVVVAQRMDPVTLQPLFERAKTCTFAWPTANRFLVFPGTALHGVMGGRAEEEEAAGGSDMADRVTQCSPQRITLIVNWWAEALEDASAVPFCQYRRKLAMGGANEENEARGVKGLRGEDASGESRTRSVEVGGGDVNDGDNGGGVKKTEGATDDPVALLSARYGAPSASSLPVSASPPSISRLSWVDASILDG